MRLIEKFIDKLISSPRIFVRVVEAISWFVLALSMSFLFLVVAVKLLLRCL